MPIWSMLGLGLVLIGLMAVLYLFDPEVSRFYPLCPFHALTGFQCAGCGGLRAAHAVLHGDWIAAFVYNPLLFLAAPWIVLGIMARKKYICPPILDKRGYADPHGAVGAAVVIVVLAYTVVRNLPFFPQMFG